MGMRWHCDILKRKNNVQKANDCLFLTQYAVVRFFHSSILTASAVSCHFLPVLPRQSDPPKKAHSSHIFHDSKHPSSWKPFLFYQFRLPSPANVSDNRAVSVRIPPGSLLFDNNDPWFYHQSESTLNPYVPNVGSSSSANHLYWKCHWPDAVEKSCHSRNTFQIHSS